MEKQIRRVLKQGKVSAREPSELGSPASAKHSLSIQDDRKKERKRGKGERKIKGQKGRRNNQIKVK